jgi:hypothetical protein
MAGYEQLAVVIATRHPLEQRLDATADRNGVLHGTANPMVHHALGGGASQSARAWAPPHSGHTNLTVTLAHRALRRPLRCAVWRVRVSRMVLPPRLGLVEEHGAPAGSGEPEPRHHSAAPPTRRPAGRLRTVIDMHSPFEGQK